MFDQIGSFPNLLLALHKAAKNKRNKISKKPSEYLATSAMWTTLCCSPTKNDVY